MESPTEGQVSSVPAYPSYPGDRYPTPDYDLPSVHVTPPSDEDPEVDGTEDGDYTNIAGDDRIHIEADATQTPDLSHPEPPNIVRSDSGRYYVTSPADLDQDDPLEDSQGRDQGGERVSEAGSDGSAPGACEQHSNPAFTGDGEEDERSSIGSTASDPDGTYREFSEANTLKIRRDNPSDDQSVESSQQQYLPGFNIKTKPPPDIIVETRDIEVRLGAADLSTGDIDAGRVASSTGSPGVPHLVRPVRRHRFPTMKTSGPKSRRKLLIILIVIFVVVILLVITVVLLVVLRPQGSGSE